MNWKEFFEMGGYGFFVWTSYGVFFAVLLFSVLAPVIRRRSLARELREQWAVDARRREAR